MTERADIKALQAENARLVARLVALLESHGIVWHSTPIRRDGQQPIIFMQCGPIRHTAARPASAPHDLEVVPRSRFALIDLAASAGIQDVFRHLANDLSRTQAIAAEAAAAFGQGRKVLVLTERTEHLDAILLALNAQVPPPFVLHGRMSKKQRAALITELDALPPGTAAHVGQAAAGLSRDGVSHGRRIQWQRRRLARRPLRSRCHARTVTDLSG